MYIYIYIYVYIYMHIILHRLNIQTIWFQWSHGLARKIFAAMDFDELDELEETRCLSSPL